jgi:hypothetical protein
VLPIKRQQLLYKLRRKCKKNSIETWKSSVLLLLLVGNQIGDSIRAEEVDAIIKDTKNIVVHLAHLDLGWEFVVDDAKNR